MGEKNILKQRLLINILTRLIGAVKSKHPAAFYAIWLKLISPITRILDYIIALFNNSSISDNQFPKVLMIVSPPRAGATIIYQIVTRIIPSIYITNLHVVFPRFASKYLNNHKLFGNKLPGIKNYYGYTNYFNDVYEGNEFIDAIFKGNPSKLEINKRFKKLLKKLNVGKNDILIFKNARNFNNILKLHEALPEILFLRIKRNIEQNIQSELSAYYELKTFHPIPEKFKNDKFYDPVEFTVKLIKEIENTIDTQKKQIDSNNWIQFNYEDFCNSPEKHINELAKLLSINFSDLRYNNLNIQLKPSARKKVNDNDELKIKELLNKINENN